jgi:CrcB protein
VAAVFAGGFTGAILRVAVTDAWAREPATWPWATFLVNVAGAFALGWLLARLREQPAGRRRYLRPLLGTGLCGALTTISALELELLRMLDAGAVVLAAAYALVSMAAGVAAVALAARLARRPEVVG